MDNQVTVIIKRRVQPSKQAEFESWSRGVIAEAAKFPGHMGATLLSPDVTGSENLLIFRFDTDEHLAAWDKSAVKSQWLEKIKDITIGEVDTKKITGLEYWFHLPEVPASAMPKRWKMVIVTVIGIYPLSLLVTKLLHKWLIKLSEYPRGLVVSVLLVLLMTYVVMPWLTRLFKKWLFPKI